LFFFILGGIEPLVPAAVPFMVLAAQPS